MSDSPIPNLKSADKVVAGVIALLVVGTLGYGFAVALPFLIELAKNSIIFVAELAALAILLLIVCDKNTWSAVFYKWKSISRNIRKSIVREDPIGVLDTVVHRFAAKLDQIDENIASAVGARKRQDDNIRRAQVQADNERSLAATATRLGKSPSEIGQHATASDRWRKAADDMLPMATTLANMQTCLERARDLCGSRLEDLKNQKAVMGMKLEALKDGQRTVRSFKRFFGTNPDLDMQELAIDEIERQSTEAEAEIDQFMRVTNPLLDKADLQKNADAMQAMDRLNTYLGSAEVAKQITAGPTPASVVPVKDGVVVDRNGRTAALTPR